MRSVTVFGSGLATVVIALVLPGCSSQASSPGQTPKSPDAVAPAGGKLEAALKTKEEATSASAPAAAATPGKTEPTKGGETAPEGAAPSAAPDMPALIAGLQSPYSVAVYQATETFRKLPADVRRKVLSELSASESASVRHNAWRAFANWATREDVPTIIAALESPYEEVRSEALTLLARFPNAETLGVLTKALEDPLRRERAEALLVSVGPAAEPAALAYSTNADADLRAAAWRILGRIGTRKGLLALEKVATQANFQQDTELQQAMQRIRERLRR